ncbi:MAG TPA: hypothetical protein VM533_13165 [Fimbriiglobus sp.]|jgi:hypothetical protein|nr:hypothetical protein [Fimbriiglobus sp.]
MRWALLIAVASLGFASRLTAADLSKIDRTITKEPAYATKAPRYCLLVFGPEAKFRSWVVLDGDSAYADRNGNGDLTDDGAPAKRKDSEFDLGELRDGDRVHKFLSVASQDLADLASVIPDTHAARETLAKDPKARAYRLSADVAAPGRGKGRVLQVVGPFDPYGVFQFAARSKDAPVVWLGGPLQVSLYASKPTLRLARSLDLMLAVGTPGVGPGSFASVGYDDLIPKDAHPVAEFAFSGAKPGDPPVRERYELKQRC